MTEYESIESLIKSCKDEVEELDRARNRLMGNKPTLEYDLMQSELEVQLLLYKNALIIVPGGLEDFRYQTGYNVIPVKLENPNKGIIIFDAEYKGILFGQNHDDRDEKGNQFLLDKTEKIKGLLEHDTVGIINAQPMLIHWSSGDKSGFDTAYYGMPVKRI